MQVREVMRKYAIDLEGFEPGLADLTVEELKERLKLDKVAKLSFNESPWGPFPSAIEAMKNVMSNLNLYPDATGEKLRLKLADLYGLDKDYFVLSNGADELISLIAQAFLNEGDEAVIPFPTFGQYFPPVRLMGAKINKVDLKDYKVDLENVYKLINESTKLVVICNPNNPTGTIIEGKELIAFLDKIPKNVVVVIDEAYAEYVEDANFISGSKLVKDYNNVIVVRTFSKIYALAAARVGYGIAGPDLIKAINKVRPPFNVNVFAQVAALKSLEDRERFYEIKKYTTEAKKKLYNFLQGLGLSYIPSETNFVLIDTGMDCNLVFKYLASKGVIIRTADGWGLPKHIRLTIGSPEEMELFCEEFKKLYE